MREVTLDQISRAAFALFFLRVLASPEISVTAVAVLVLLSALLAGVEALRIVSKGRDVSDLHEAVETLQNKLASLSVAVGLGVRK